MRSVIASRAESTRLATDKRAEDGRLLDWCGRVR